MTFRVGQRVVCINDAPCTWSKVPTKLVKGSVYTVQGYGNPAKEDGEASVFLNEVKSTSQIFKSGEYGFRVSRFRPVVELKDDITMFQALCPGLPVVPPAVVPPRVPAHQT